MFRRNKILLVGVTDDETREQIHRRTGLSEQDEVALSAHDLAPTADELLDKYGEEVPGTDNPDDGESVRRWSDCGRLHYERTIRSAEAVYVDADVYHEERYRLRPFLMAAKWWRDEPADPPHNMFIVGHDEGGQPTFVEVDDLSFP